MSSNFGYHKSAALHLFSLLFSAFFAILLSSTASERDFSMANMLFTPQCNRLDSGIIEDIIFVRSHGVQSTPCQEGKNNIDQ